jgi:putative transposase
MISFKGRHHTQEMILQCVRWYVAYSLSYRDWEELMQERGYVVDHSTIQRWVVLYAPRIEKAFRESKKRVGRRWRLDETYSVPGVQHKHGSLNEPRVYLKYICEMARAKSSMTMPGCAGTGV